MHLDYIYLNDNALEINPIDSLSNCTHLHLVFDFADLVIFSVITLLK